MTPTRAGTEYNSTKLKNSKQITPIRAEYSSTNLQNSTQTTPIITERTMSSVPEAILTKIQEDVYRNLVKNFPKLKESTPEAISRFIAGWDTYSEMLAQAGIAQVPYQINYCIKAEVLSEFLAIYSLTNDAEQVELQLRKIAKDHNDGERFRCVEKLEKLTWKITPDLAEASDKFLQNLTKAIMNAKMTKGEEEAMCDIILEAIPEIFFNKGREYQKKSKDLRTFERVISYTKEIPRLLAQTDPNMIVRELKRLKSKNLIKTIEQKGEQPQNERKSPMKPLENRNMANRPYKPFRSYPFQPRNIDHKSNWQNNPVNNERNNKSFQRRETLPKQESRSTDRPGPSPEWQKGSWRRSPVKAQRINAREPKKEDNFLTSEQFEKPKEAEQAYKENKEQLLVEDYEVDWEAGSLKPNVDNQIGMVSCNSIKTREPLYLRTQIYLKNMEDNKWRKARAVLDSGADLTACNKDTMLRLVGKNSFKLWSSADGIANHVVTAGGDKYPVIGTSKTSIQIVLGEEEPLLLKNVKIIGIDAPDWDTLLLGENVLSRLKLMPAQNLHRLAGRQLDFDEGRSLVSDLITVKRDENIEDHSEKKHDCCYDSKNLVKDELYTAGKLANSKTKTDSCSSAILKKPVCNEAKTKNNDSNQSKGSSGSEKLLEDNKSKSTNDKIGVDREGMDINDKCAAFVKQYENITQEKYDPSKNIEDLLQPVVVNTIGAKRVKVLTRVINDYDTQYDQKTITYAGKNRLVKESDLILQEETPRSAESDYVLSSNYGEEILVKSVKEAEYSNDCDFESKVSVQKQLKTNEDIDKLPYYEDIIVPPVYEEESADLKYVPEVGYGENVDQLMNDLGYSTEKDVLKTFNKQLDEAYKNKIVTRNQGLEYNKLLRKFVECFGTKQSVTRMSDLPPLQVRVKPGQAPVNENYRKLSVELKEVLRKKLNDLLRIKMIEHDDNPYWASPAFLVPKPNGVDWRMVIDLRRVNECCETQALKLPELEAQISYLPNEIAYMATFDMLSGFDLLRCHPDSTQYFGVTTIFGNFRLLGSPMGFKNTPSVYQNRLMRYILGGVDPETSLFCARNNGCLLWLDDIFVYATTWKGFIEVISKILDNMKKYKVRFNAKKCHLIATSLSWCGREINTNGWRFAPLHFNKILNIARPINLKQLQSVIYVLSWLNMSIPKASQMKERLLDLVTNTRKSAGLKDKKTRKSDAKIKLAWNAELDDAWKNLKELLAHCSRMNLKSFTNKALMVVYTDASDKFWASVIVQEINDKKLPMVFASGRFTGSQKSWSINDKECYAIIATVKRFDYLIVNHKNVIVRTDHNNFRYLFKPSKHTDIRSSTLGRIARWALALQEANIKIEIIKGEDNKLADLLSRWGYPAALKQIDSSLKSLYVRCSSVDSLEVQPESKAMDNWTKFETEKLCRGIHYFGVGNWKELHRCGILPGKSIPQLIKKFESLIPVKNYQEFKTLRVDPRIISKKLMEWIRLKKCVVSSDGNVINYPFKAFNRRLIFPTYILRHPNFSCRQKSVLETLQKDDSQGAEFVNDLEHIPLIPIHHGHIHKTTWNTLTPNEKQVYFIQVGEFIRELKRLVLRNIAWGLTQKAIGNKDDSIRLTNLKRWWCKMIPVFKKLNDRPHVTKGFIGQGFLKKSQSHSMKNKLMRIMEKRPTKEQEQQEFETFARERLSFLHPNYIGKFKPLCATDIQSFQKKHCPPPAAVENPKTKLLEVHGRTWIPESLVPRLIVSEHINAAHASIKDELAEITRKYYLTHPVKQRLELQISKFHERCLHCEKKPALIRRPLHMTWQAEKPNEIIHGDYLKIEGEYLLVLMDNLTRKIELIHRETCDAEGMVLGLLWWAARFGLRTKTTLVTDQGSHFCNKIVTETTKLLGHRHELSVAYAPWTNGSIEVVNQRVITLFRSLLSQYKLHRKEWRSVIPLVQMYANVRKNHVWKNLSAHDLYFGNNDDGGNIIDDLKPETLEDIGFPIYSLTSQEYMFPVDVARVQYDLEELSRQLISKWKDVKDIRYKLREQKNQRMNKRLGVKDIQFGIGDFVLLSKKGTTRRESKVKLTWTGPHKVIDIPADNVYTIIDPLGSKTTAHAVRLRFYEDKSFNLTEEIKEVYINDVNDAFIDEIVELRNFDGEYFLKVKWFGFGMEDATWEPVENLLQDAPDLVNTYLAAQRDENANHDYVYRKYILGQRPRRPKRNRKVPHMNQMLKFHKVKFPRLKPPGPYHL